MKGKIKPPTGKYLKCKNWQIEAAYRMIQHNLDSDVAENPDELIVYGGKGKAEGTGIPTKLFYLP